MITIISGTNRQQAMTWRISLIYQEMLRAQNAEAQILDLDALPPDFITTALYQNAGKSEAFNRLVQPVSQSNKLVFIVPEYNGSFPGVLKAFIDGLPYPSPLTDKKVALVGLSSGSQGGSLALSHLTDILNYLGVNVLGNKVRLAHVEKLIQKGELTDDFHRQLLEVQIDKLLNF